MVTLSEFYHKMDHEVKVCDNKIEQFKALAKMAGVSRDTYEKDSVFIALMLEKDHYRFIKDKLMENMR